MHVIVPILTTLWQFESLKIVDALLKWCVCLSTSM